MPNDGDDHWQWYRRRLSSSFSKAASLPVRLSSAMNAGASGARILAWVAVDAVRRAQIEQIAVDQDRATGGVVRADAQIVDQVEAPDDVGVAGLQLDRRLVRADHVLALVAERPVVAVGLAVHVEAQDFGRMVTT